MNIPVITQILNEIGARLENISTTNGYFLDIEKIERARLTPLKNSDMPAITFYSGVNELREFKYGIDFKTVTVTIECYTITRDANFNDLTQLLASDLEIAIHRSTSSPAVSDDVSTALGGLVEQLTINSSTPVMGENNKSPYAGAILSIEVNYKVKKGHPYVLIN